MTRAIGRTVRAFAAVALVLFSRCAPADVAPAGTTGRPGVVSALATRDPSAAVGFAADRVLVRFRPAVTDAEAEGLLRSYGFAAVRRIPAIGVYAVRTAPGASVAETLALLGSDTAVETARPDYRVRLAEVPNDAYFLSYQYNLRNAGGILDLGGGERYFLTAGADIKAVPAWDEAKGDAEVVIAVLDTGVDAGHPDLAGKVVDGGYDFANDDGDPRDDHWHGTHVAGIAAAGTGNGIGIAGVAWNCRILPVKVVDENGDGYYSWIIDGILWAADQGADVINISLGGDVPDPFLEDACAYAFDRGAVVVAASGNDAGPVLYPAAYDDHVLAVGASDFNDAVTSFSNRGPEVDVVAPGAWILSTSPRWYSWPGDPPYLFASGTSAAAPHVAGLAALIRSLKPGLTPEEIMWIIRYTADDINGASAPGRDDAAGYGRINMRRALVPYILE